VIGNPGTGAAFSDAGRGSRSGDGGGGGESDARRVFCVCSVRFELELLSILAVTAALEVEVTAAFCC